MRENRQSGRVKQTAPAVTDSEGSAELPIIGLAALLQLVDWCEARGLKDLQGGPSCVDVVQPLSPPAPDRASPTNRPSPALADSGRRPARSHSASSRPHRTPTTDESSDDRGGDA